MMLQEELEIQKQCAHPNLVHYLAKFEDREYVYIVMQYVAGRSLRRFIRQNPKSTSGVARGIVHQVAMALFYLKQFGIIHRDVKPDNILLTGHFFTQHDPKTQEQFHFPQIKLTDYGLSTTLLPSQRSKLFCGSRYYTAPQLFANQPYDFQVDIYSLGVVFYELVTGIIPFKTKDYDQFAKNVLYTEPVYHLPNQVKLPVHITVLLKRGYQFERLEMLAKDPHSRVEVADLLTSRYLLQNQPLLLQKRLSSSKAALFSAMTAQ